jgi:hypothetical protein
MTAMLQPDRRMGLRSVALSITAGIESHDAIAGCGECADLVPTQIPDEGKPAALHKQDAGERRARRRGFGSNGSRRAHSASSKRGCAMRDRTKSTAQVQEISQRF